MEGLMVLLMVLGLSTDLVKGYAYSIRIDEHERACFGFDVKAINEEVYVDLQVSQGGDTDIDWQLFDTNGNEVQSGQRMNSANLAFNATVSGAYSICMDNSFSSDYKVVTLVVESDLPEDMQKMLGNMVSTDADLPQEFKETWLALMRNAEKLVEYHEIHAAKQKRHYFLVDSNLSRVNGFSLLSCFIMISVGIIQVVVVKGLFEGGSKKSFVFW